MDGNLETIMRFKQLVGEGYTHEEATRIASLEATLRHDSLDEKEMTELSFLLERRKAA